MKTKTAKSKVCGRCNKSKPLVEFSRNKKAKDGRQSYCVACKAKYYQWERKQPTFDGRLLNKDSKVKVAKAVAHKPQSKLLTKMGQVKRALPNLPKVKVAAVEVQVTKEVTP